MANAPDPLASAYEIAKLHAAVDGAFDEKLMRHWFGAAWALCAQYAGIVFPAARIDELVSIGADGALTLSQTPSSDVRFYAGGKLVATLPPGSPCFQPRSEADDFAGCRMCCPDLCCYCDLRASYTAGMGAGCDDLPPGIVQAVARVFAYIVENRGDAELDEHVLGKCGAKAFLSPYLTYVM